MFDRRTYARLYARGRYQRKLARERLRSRTCPRRFGKHGICGAVLSGHTDGNGRLIVSCWACDRFERGICRVCVLSVAGTVRKARYCARHKAEATAVSLERYRARNRKLLNRRARKYAQRRAVQEHRKRYKRLWRKAHPEKIRAQKRRAALRQSPKLYEWHRQYRARLKEQGTAPCLGARTCLTPDCITPVSGRVKKCAPCKERERQEALALLATSKGRGRRTDLERKRRAA